MPRRNEQVERNAVIAAKVAGGRTFADVGREYGIDRTRIKQICGRYGVKSPQPYVRLSEDEKTTIKAMHARGIPLAIFAREMGRKEETVRDFLVRSGLHVVAPLQPPWTEAEDQAIKDGYYPLGSRAVAKQLGRTRNEVIGRADRLKRNGEKLAPAKEQF